MKKLVICLTTMCALAISSSVWGQAQEPKQQPQRQQEPRQAGGETLTGCLTEQGGSFTLKTQTGDNVPVIGSADLAKHTNHTVKLTGSVSDAGGKKALNVAKIEHVSPSCSN
jgi:hypothetical protein